MTESPDAVVIEEIEIEKPSSSAWYVLGALAVVIGLVFGVRALRKKQRASEPATPTDELPA
jgi:hypothetical protein